MEISHTHFGVYVVPRDNSFTPRQRWPGYPSQTLTVAKNRGLDIRHQRGRAEPLGDDAL